MGFLQSGSRCGSGRCGFRVGAVMLFIGSMMAHATENNFAQWTSLFTQGTLGRPDYGWYFETQNRLNDGYELGDTPNARFVRGNRLLVRTAVRWMPESLKGWQFHLGYGWTPNLSPERDESRIYQQVSWQTTAGLWTWAVRWRLEQRWIENTSAETAWRTRLLLRGQYALNESGNLQLVVWDEAFYHLNDVTNGPRSGFDQNRLFVGPQFRVTPQARLEVGYMNNWIWYRAENRDVSSHVYVASAILDFP